MVKRTGAYTTAYSDYCSTVGVMSERFSEADRDGFEGNVANVGAMLDMVPQTGEKDIDSFLSASKGVLDGSVSKAEFGVLAGDIEERRMSLYQEAFAGKKPRREAYEELKKASVIEASMRGVELHTGVEKDVTPFVMAVNQSCVFGKDGSTMERVTEYGISQDKYAVETQEKSGIMGRLKNRMGDMADGFSMGRMAARARHVERKEKAPVDRSDAR